MLVCAFQQDWSVMAFKIVPTLQMCLVSLFEETGTVLLVFAKRFFGINFRLDNKFFRD